MTFALELARTYAGLRDRSFEELEAKLQELEAEWTARVAEPEALETRRRVAEELLMGAYARGVQWPHFSRALARIRALGYSNLEREVHVACLFARWAHARQEHEEEARAALNDAAQRIAADSPLQASIERTRADTGYR